MTLTEQWKKGELKAGWYYVSRNNDIEMLEYDGDYFFSVDVPLIDYKDVGTLEVLAPVPSYEEWKQLHKFLDEFNALEVAKENQQLKKLLWACQDELYSHLDSDAEAMADTITKVIGEKK